MEARDVIEIGRQAITTMLMIGAPILLIALIVGLAVSLFQALTQMQEMTLSFVPKMLIIFLSVMIFMPFMLATLSRFTLELVDRIAGLG
ncbi:MAG: flagellar biosynthesis protein FliQ [Rhodospirillaceae bacterium]|nr:flagellar biosynthesis protein FliQ [Rhodospirillaceae bacterium]